MPKFEVAIFNQDVRDLVKSGEEHERYEDNWADLHYISILAPDEDVARAKIEKQYPAQNGFRITQIVAEESEDDY